MNAPTSDVRPDTQSDAPPATRTPVTCTIVAYNEADRIHRAIESVKDLVDEILVIDSGRPTAPWRLCESFGARVTYNPWPGYGPQKRLAEDLAKHDWILNLDADEQLSDDLREEIWQAIAHPIPSERAFSVARVDIYPKRDKPAPFAYRYPLLAPLPPHGPNRIRDLLANDLFCQQKTSSDLRGLALPQKHPKLRPALSTKSVYVGQLAANTKTVTKKRAATASLR